MRGHDLFFNPDLNIGNRVSTNRTATVVRGTDSVWRADRHAAAWRTAVCRHRSTAHHRVRIQQLRCVERVGRKALQQRLQRTWQIFTWLHPRHLRRPGRHTAIPEKRRPETRHDVRQERRGPRARVHDERPDGGSEASRRDVQRYAAGNDRLGDDAAGRYPRRRPERHPVRTVAGRHLQHHSHLRHEQRRFRG